MSFKEKRFTVNYIHLRKNNSRKYKKKPFYSSSSKICNSIRVISNFTMKFRQYFRFFVFFKYLLRHFRKKKTKGFMDYFFLIPRHKKGRNSRMGKGNGAYKGYFWQSKAGSDFLVFINSTNFFLLLLLKKVNEKLPKFLKASVLRGYIFKKNNELAFKNHL